MIKYSIVTAYVNQVRMTQKFLRNLKRRVPKETEIILINAGNEFKINHRSRTDFRRIDLEKNISFSHSMNTGIKAARGKYIIVIGNDVFPKDKDWLEKLSEVFVKFPEAMISTPDNSNPGKLCAGNLIATHGVFEEYDFFPAVCWMLSRKTIEEVGLFDENFIVGQYEDNDYSIRIRNLGGKIILRSDLILKHLMNQEVGAFNIHKLDDVNSAYLKNKHNIK